LTDLDDIRLPTENLLNSFVSGEDSNNVAILGRINISGYSAKVKGEGVSFVKLELPSVFGEGEKNLVLGFASLVLDLSNLHGGSKFRKRFTCNGLWFDIKMHYAKSRKAFKCCVI
jgi:hypothetical protein